MRKITAIAVLVFLVAACGEAGGAGGASQPSTTAPTTTSPDTPTDSGQSTTTTVPVGGVKGEAFVDAVDLLFLESYPVQVHASIRGSLPTPCHTLDWTLGQPDPGGRISLDVYSRYDPAQVCAQVLQPFEETISIGAFTSGSYVLVVNGVEYPFDI